MLGFHPNPRPTETRMRRANPMTESEEQKDRENPPSVFPVRKENEPPITPETEKKFKEGLERALEEEKRRHGK
jgi:hypothetical protein